MSGRAPQVVVVILLLGITAGAPVSADEAMPVLTGSREMHVQWLEVPPAPGDPLGAPEIRDQERIVREAVARGAGEGVRELFAAARWEFHDDGRFLVTLHPSTPPNALFPLAGTYQRNGEETEIAARSEGAAGLLALDGVLRKEGQLYQLEAVSGWSSMMGVRFAYIEQTLSPDSQGESQASAFIEESMPVGPPPEGWRFLIALEGDAGGVAFHGLQGSLSITRELWGDVYLLSLATAGAIQPGWVLWEDTPVDAAALARGEPVTLSFVPPESTVDSVHAVRWYAASPAFTRKATLRLKLIDPRTLEGEIESEGLSGEGLAPVSYRAALTGGPDGSVLEQRMSAALAEADFAGVWRLEDGRGNALDNLTVRREGEGWAGTLGSRRFKGRQAGGRLDLVEVGGAKNRISLRALGGRNVAAGLWSSAREPARILTARRSGTHSLPPEIAGALAAAGEKDADALRSRAGDLGLQGRCEEARWFLETALRIYGKALADSRTTFDRSRVITNIQISLQKLFSCGQGLEGIQSIVRTLDIVRDLLEARRTADRRALQDQVRELQRSLEFFSGLFDTVKLRQLPEDGELQDRVTASAGDLGSVFRAILQASAELASLEVGWDRREPRDLHRLLGESRVALRDLADQAFERINARMRDLLIRDSALLETHDRYWQSIPNRADSPRDLDLQTMQRLEEDLEIGVRQSGRLRAPEKAFYNEQARAGQVLRVVASSLDAEQQGLAVSQPEGYLDMLASQAVATAEDLAMNPEVWWSQAYSDAGKQAALSLSQPFFEALISFLLDAGKPGEALQVSEIARSRAFADLLIHREIVREELAKAALSGASSRTLPNPLAARPIPLDDLIGVARQRGGAIVEYWLLPEAVAIWVISPRGEVNAVTRPAAGVRESVAEIRRLLEGSEDEPSQSRAEKIDVVLRRLHAFLIQPVAAFLPPGEALTLVPHQDLFGVPFAALKDEEGRYLIDRHPLAYGVSLSVLHLNRKRREEPGPPVEERLLALVNPWPLAAGEEGRDFGALTWLEERFTSRIAGFYPNREVLTGLAANREALFEKAPRATILHLVAHARFVDSDPLASFLALAPGDASTDGRLSVTDIFKLDLRSDLTILWACETGLGRVSADGVEGLSRAFTWAGTSSLILSLWEIPERMTALQMNVFHELWRNRKRSKAQALQGALSELARNYPDQPELWAGFVLYGEAD